MKTTSMTSENESFPAVAVPPQDHPPLSVTQQSYSDLVVPLGVSSEGRQANWQPRKDGNLLVVGGTGSGKTVVIDSVIQRLTQAGWRTWLIDAKRIEFIGYRDWENVELLAQKVDHQIRMLKLAHETMKARYDLIQRGEVSIEDLDPIAVVVDHLQPVLLAVAERYRETKVEGMPSQHPALNWVADIARLGRASKMHLVVTLQRLDASLMGREMLDNFGGRLSLGNLGSKEASIMMWDDPDVGVSLPSVKGRAVSYIDGEPAEVQAVYTASPDPEHANYQAGMVSAMRPKYAIHGSKTIAEPRSQIVEGAGDEPVTTWNSIVEAQILSEGAPVQLDPVASDKFEQLRLDQAEAERTQGSPQLQVAGSLEDAVELFNRVDTHH